MWAAMGCASLRMGGCGAGAGCTCSAAVAVGNERSWMSFQIMRVASVPAVTSMGKAALPTTMGKLLLGLYRQPRLRVMAAMWAMLRLQRHVFAAGGAYAMYC